MGEVVFKPSLIPRSWTDLIWLLVQLASMILIGIWLLVAQNQLILALKQNGYFLLWAVIFVVALFWVYFRYVQDHIKNKIIITGNSLTIIEGRHIFKFNLSSIQEIKLQYGHFEFTDSGARYFVIVKKDEVTNLTGETEIILFAWDYNSLRRFLDFIHSHYSSIKITEVKNDLNLKESFPTFASFFTSKKK